MSTLQEYLAEIQKKLAYDAREHTHRAALKALVESAGEGITVTSNPVAALCGKPPNKPPVNYHWNNISIGVREAICWGACLSDSLAPKRWEQLEPWMQELLVESVTIRSNQSVLLCG